MLGWYGRSQLHGQCPTTVSATITPLSEDAAFFTLGRGTQSSGARLRNASSYLEQPSGNLAAQHSCKHPAEVSHAAWPGNQQPTSGRDLGAVGLPGEVTGSSGTSPASQPQSLLPLLTITYVGFLNSFFLHSCLNSTGKRKRRPDVEDWFWKC